MMRMSELLENLHPDAAQWERRVQGITADSREVKPDYIFAALAGVRENGMDYIDDAIERGAAAIIAETNISDLPVPVIAASQPRQLLAYLARRYFAFMPDNIAAVTGTNGKTSVAFFIYQLLRLLDRRAAYVGTIGVCAGDWQFPLQHTTPEPVKLHQILRDLHARAISHLVIEASSHGLAQFRLDGLSPQVAGFTNLSQDHLDYHASFADYRAAKKRLFTELLRPDGTAVIWTQSEAGEDLAKDLTCKLLSVGYENARLCITKTKTLANGFALNIAYEGEDYNVTFPVAGSFQIENLGVALGMVMALLPDVPLATIIPHIARLQAPEGRMQYIAQTPKGAHAFVDYAHTPDALATALQAVRIHTDGKLYIVFGCGGNRDTEKRPLMGAAAAQYADMIMVTDDNPRDEDPATIRAAIMSACPHAQNIADRGAAIAMALSQAEQGDIVLVAGKGHERGQIIGAKTYPFHDPSFIADYIATKIETVS